MWKTVRAGHSLDLMVNGTRSGIEQEGQTGNHG